MIQICLKVSDETQQLRKKQQQKRNKGARDNVYILFYYVNFLFFFFSILIFNFSLSLIFRAEWMNRMCLLFAVRVCVCTRISKNDRTNE